jgi:hypothetical protein
MTDPDTAPRTGSAGVLASAADTLCEAVDSVAPGGLPVLIVARGDHELWDATCKRLADAGRPVLRESLERGAKDWDPWGAVRDRAGVRALIHHDPFAAQSSGCDAADIRRAVARGVGLVFVDFPHGLRDAAVERRLTDVYLTALARPPSPLRAAAARVRALLDGATAVVVASEAASLRIEGPWAVRDDWISAGLDVPVRQLPNGEVWLACDPERVDGEVVLGHGGPRPVRIRRGRIVRDPAAHDAPGPGDLPDPVVELGIGLNPAAPWLRGTCLVEKAAGRLHLGFGDNTLLGGGVHAPFHYDVPLARDCEAWALHDDGRRVRVAPLR